MIENEVLLQRLNEGETSALDELVENNMGLVYNTVNRFCNRGCEREDLIQIGAMGLIKAAKKFDISFNVKFSTYAVPMIMGEIKRFLRDDGAIKVSRTIKDAAAKGRRSEEILRNKLGRNPTIKEISEHSGIDTELLIQAFDAATPPESLQNYIGDEDGMSLMELVSDKETEEKIVNNLYIKQSLAMLDRRERDIILLRYFKGKTQSEIAKLIGVSQVQISRIEKKALLKMRDIS